MSRRNRQPSASKEGKNDPSTGLLSTTKSQKDPAGKSTLISNLRGDAYRCKNDRSWTMLDVSDGIRALSGYSPNDFLEGKIHWGDLIHPEDRQHVWDDVQASLSKKLKYQVVYRINHANIGLRWMWDQGRGLRSSKGDLIALEGFLTDVTKLKNTEERLRRMSKVFMDGADPILIEDLTGNIIDLNKEAERAYGWTREELLGKPIKTIVPAERHQQADELLSRCKLEEEVRNVEGLRRTKAGDVFPVLITLSLLSDDSGKAMGIATICKNISRQKQTEVALRRMSKVFMDGADPILIEDLTGNIIDLNKEAERAYGWTREELLGKPIKTIVPAERHQQADELLSRCKLEEEVRNVEGLRRTKAGDVFPVLITLSLLSDDSGKAMSIATISKNISRQKQIEEALREREERLRAIVNTAVEAILTINLKGIVQSCNPAAESMFGYAADEVIGKNVKILMPSPYRERHDGYVKNYLKTGKKKIIGIGREVEARRKDGTIFPIHLSVAEVDHLGIFTGVIRDLTEQKNAEKALKKAREELMLQTLFTQRLSALATMAGGIAHELNQPLSSIGLYAATIRNMIKSKETVDTSLITGNLDEISKQVSRASKIIDHMREFASDNKKIGNNETTLHQAIDSVLTLIGQQLRNHNIECRNDVEPELKVKIDQTRLEQVLVILVSNAKDSIDGKTFPPGQNGTIRFTSEMDEQSISLRIHDNGNGIHETVRNKLFEPFITTKGPDKGTGLGLSICHGILRDYNARIEVEETNDTRTIFRLLFPRET